MNQRKTRSEADAETALARMRREDPITADALDECRREQGLTARQTLELFASSLVDEANRRGLD